MTKSKRRTLTRYVVVGMKPQMFKAVEALRTPNVELRGSAAWRPTKQHFDRTDVLRHLIELGLEVEAKARAGASR